MSKSYLAARILLGTFEVLGFLLIVLAGFVLFGNGPQVDPLYRFLAAALVAGFGVIFMGLAQVIRAQVDTAVNTARMVAILEGRGAPPATGRSIVGQPNVGHAGAAPQLAARRGDPPMG